MKSIEAKLIINDLFKELKEENNRLFDELLFAQKFIKLLENYRNCLNVFSNCCECYQNINNKILINDLENEYKIVKNNKKLSEINEEINNKSNINELKVSQEFGDSFHKTDNDFDEYNEQELESNYDFVEDFDNDNEIEDKKWVKNNVKKSKRKEQKVNDINDEKYFCGLNGCMFESNSINNLKVHKRRHFREKRYKCIFSDCNSCFAFKSELNSHRKSIHNSQRVFICESSGCDQRFSTSVRLKRHMISHTGQYPYVCQWSGCESKFITNSNLRSHENSVHSNVYSVECHWPGCEAQFKQKRNLRKHIQSHTKEKPFLCEWPDCDARFRTNQMLIRHKSIHNGIKPYACDWPECHEIHY